MNPPSAAQPRWPTPTSEAAHGVFERDRWKDRAASDAWTGSMLKFLLWLLLLVLCWPLALLALILYPIVWLVLLPFRLAGIAVEGVLDLVRSIVLLPARIMRLGQN